MDGNASHPDGGKGHSTSDPAAGGQRVTKCNTIYPTALLSPSTPCARGPCTDIRLGRTSPIDQRHGKPASFEVQSKPTSDRNVLHYTIFDNPGRSAGLLAFRTTDLIGSDFTDPPGEEGLTAINGDAPNARQRECHACCENAVNPKASYSSWPEPEQNWSRIRIDFAGPIHGSKWLLLIDAKSKYAFAQPTKESTARTSII
uniref:Endo/exonuclease/phosphatase domain-containing protein n=1 Tax=Steinernema glaseri TaxID=37863 RepID=A0A1I7YU87_9BILA